MAAYGAVISLKNTIKLILQSSRISLDSPSPQVLQPAYEAMVRLHKVLLKLDSTGYNKIRTKVNALDERIKEAIWEFEDLFESHVYEQILPQLESQRDHLSFSVDLQSLRQSVASFVYKVMAMETTYDVELSNMSEEEGEPISSRIDVGGINSEMVGLNDEFEQVKDYLIEKDEGIRLLVTGMAGVGKTTLAKKVFDDPSVQRHFELRAWVKVGKKCESIEILRCILAQVHPNIRDRVLTQVDDDDCEKLVGLLQMRVKSKKCLVVLDDVWEWNTRVLENLEKSNVRVLLTSRKRIKASSCLKLRLLDEKESKKLFGEKLFGEEGFPHHLEELGKKIAYKCEGLPLMIVTVAELLSKEDKTLQYWTEICEKQHNSVFVDAYNQILEVLSPSYDYLPQYFKMLFLYLGAFPPYSEIDTNDLFNRLSAEGFLETIGNRTVNDFIQKRLAELAALYNLVIFKFKPGSWLSKREFRVHSCWQHLCKKEASRIKFLHVVQSYDEDMKDQRRLCAHCNTLFAFKEVYDSITSDCASMTRSILCYGPNHQYPVPLHAMDFKLLRILDACKVRFYLFPLEILKLVCLKYLALTCDKELPVSISKLFHLQFLIIKRHISIRKRGGQFYMPMEIWNMQELQHIDIFGRDLPTPNSDATLEKLTSLFGVSAKSCTREILKRISNLKALAIQMELKPYADNVDENNPLSDLGYISEELQNLMGLVFVVINPDMKYVCTTPLSMFPSSLSNLTLGGLGCPWKHMNDIGLLLPNIKKLTLQGYAFRGPEWDIESRCFLKLETLVIEDTDLVQWRPQHGSLPRLELLSIRHCYKLRQFNWTRDPSMVQTTIELVECDPLVIPSAKLLRPRSLFRVCCYSSF